MKIALIADTHWGVRNDNIAFLDNSKIFLDNVFFPYLKNNEIKTVVHLGDLVDRRKYTNTYSAFRLRTDFLEPLANGGYDVHMIVGNHDTYFKNTNSVNALQELVASSYPFNIYDTVPTEVEFGDTTVLMIPWICEDNRKVSYDKINSTKAQIAMGHLEISGFEMYRGSIVSHGDDRNNFSRFDLVFSGHYHHKSSDGAIFYLGSHGEFTWSDFDDPKGFHIFDTETRSLTFIENPYKMFKKIWYNDADENFVNSKIDYTQYKNCIVKIIVQNKENFYWFDKFVDNVQNVNPIDLQIVEDHMNLYLEEDQDIIDEAESTIDIFNKYIETVENKSVDKKKLQAKINELYNEALAIE